MRRILLITIGISSFLWADFSRNDSIGIVTDSSTRLQWQDNQTVSKTWREAINYCETLTLGGYSDWRLPNFNELYSIVDKTKSDSAIDTTFQNVLSDQYWSSSTVVSGKGYAWDVDFTYGYTYWAAKSKSYYVRCVRSGQ